MVVNWHKIHIICSELKKRGLRESLRSDFDKTIDNQMSMDFPGIFQINY